MFDATNRINLNICIIINVFFCIAKSFKMTLYDELDNALIQNDFDKFCELWARFIPFKNKTYDEQVASNKLNHAVKHHFDSLRKKVKVVTSKAREP